MRRFLRSGAWISLGCAVLACSPSSSIPSGSSTGGSGSSTGGASTGGGLFGGGGSSSNDCTDAADADADSIGDALEAAQIKDPNGDGVENAKDADSDGDGWPDKVEATNPLLDPSQPGYARSQPCDPIADTDADGVPDAYDKDSDNDGLSDKQEKAFDPSGSKSCRLLSDCDGDGVIDLIEAAAGSDPTDAKSQPEDPALFFVLPYNEGEKTQDFQFSTGVSKADVYFLVDTTASMQPAIDSLKSSISTKVIPGLLNGDAAASPPIPPIGDAWVGMGTVRDVPWDNYGQPGDDVYRHRFDVAGQTIVGNVTPPLMQNGGFVAPDNVTKILGSLTAAGGGDGPEATTQALWMASTNGLYTNTIDGLWSPANPYPAPCPDIEAFGAPCFRKDAIPIFVIVSDAPFHNGPLAVHNYDPAKVGGARPYTDALDAINAIHGKVVGVPVNTGTAGAARADLTDLANKTGSQYHDPSFGGTDRALVSQVDVTSGEVSNEVVRLLGLLSGAGLHDVTTDRANYACAGGVDCTGDGKPDLAYANPSVTSGGPPFDASKLISAVVPVASNQTPKPYSSLDPSTFFGVRGAADLSFRVHAKNDLWAPDTLVVLRAKILVETPSGQLLGGAKGVKLVYFVLPEYLPVAK